MDKIDINDISKKLIELYKYNSISYLNLENSENKNAYFKVKEDKIYLIIFSDMESIDYDLKYAINALAIKSIDANRLEVFSVLRNNEDEFNSSKFQGNYVVDHGEYKEYFILFEEEKLKITTHGGEKAKLVGEEIKNSFNSYFNENKTKEKQKIFTINNFIILINIIVFAISVYMSKNIMTIDGETLVKLGAQYPPYIAQGQYYRFFTAMFLHGGIIHITLNMYALYAIGRMVENIYGKIKYIVFYVIGGVASGIASYFINPSNSISVGASGAIFGLLGSILIFAYFRRRVLGKSFYTKIVQVIFINLAIGFLIPHTDNYGHIGGLLGGVIVSTILYDRYKDG